MIYTHIFLLKSVEKRPHTVRTYNWTSCHRLCTRSWHHIYTNIISFQSSYDWLVTHLINKAESTYEVALCFTKSTHFFLLRFLARGRSSLWKGIASVQNYTLHPPCTDLAGTFQVQYRNKWANGLWLRYWVDVTSLLVPSLSTATF